MNEIEKLQQLAGITPNIVEQPRSTTLLSEVDVNEKDAGDSDNEKLAVGHVDNERDMIKRDLFEMGSYCVELYKMLDGLPDSDFPHWWQSKIVKAEEFLSSAKGYLEAELYAPEEESPLDDVQDDDINPSGV